MSGVTLPGGSVKNFGYDPMSALITNAVDDPAGNSIMSRAYQRNALQNITGQSTEFGEYQYHYNTARYYESISGRYLSGDPIGEPGFELVAARPKSPPEKLSESMLSALNAVRKFIRNSPNTAIVENTSVIQDGPAYVFALNNPVILYDPLGLDCPACDSGIGTHSLPIHSDGGLRCCAQHDQCFDQNHCTASSWASTFIKLDLLAHGILIPFTPCERCNVAVLVCMLNPPDTGPMYYCRNLGRFVDIPRDFRNLDAAKKCCCN